jgi:hypothetical protein
MKNDERAVRDQVQRNVTPVIPHTLNFADRQRLENAASDQRQRTAEKKSG